MSRAPAVTVSDDIDEIPAPAWGELMTAIRAPVFYRRDFVRAYQRSNLGGAMRTVYLTVAGGGGALAAALPAYLLDAAETGRVLGMPALAADPRPALLGHLPHCYDTALPIRGGDPEVLAVLWSALRAEGRRAGAATIGLMNVPAGSPARAALERLPGVAVVPGAARWSLDASAYPDLDRFLAVMSRSTRRNLRGARSRADRDGARIEITAHGPADDHAAIDDAVALCVATAAKHGSRYYPGGPLRRFLGELDDYLVIRVRLGDRTLAASICLREASVLHTWAGGAHYPPELRWSPNHVLFHAELELGFRIGVERIHCGRRNDEFKARHRLTREELVACLESIA
ncbi:MAG TPA: GNAT family N-acetyltransferase [Kofleriaceae bacterium]|nr:GNAT family N-acetyltransferase [Kofleriaceae bacterium]